MENMSDRLMLSEVVAHCHDCGDEAIFVPIDDGCETDGCEFSCTRCDAAVFLLEVLENTGAPHGQVA